MTTTRPVVLERIADVPPRERFDNRELSWLEFDARVLALAENGDLPLLERVRFLAIFQANLDEFFQIRVAGLKEQVRAGLPATSPDGMTPPEQLERISERVRTLLARQHHTWSRSLRPRLANAGIRILDWAQLDPAAALHLRETFEERVYPILTPLSVDPVHPFPYISNLSLNLAVEVRDPATGVERFARVKVPPNLPRFLALPDGERFVPIEQVIAAHTEMLFPGMQIAAAHPFRITRDADLELEIDEAEDLLSQIESILRQRERSPEAVRLEVPRTMPKAMRALLREELELDQLDVYVFRSPLGLSDLFQLTALERSDLKYEPWSGRTQRRLQAAAAGRTDIFTELRQGDILVQHPYDAFDTSVELFVDQASRDPHVLAIKQTLYRTSDKDSAIVRSLVRAAEAGKQVAALVELTARFDEEANITWARVLEQAGVHVVYGVVGLKTHAKVSLVVRDEGGSIRRYCHVGTGNYHPDTARLYEDLGLLTAEPELTADVADLFNFLTGYSNQADYRRILVAPVTLRQRLLELIEEQGRPDGRITMKMNSLVDAQMIDALYAASQEGCRIDLVVRGICCLRPGIPGLSERIRVRSIVGRYLEHSRIFRFGVGEGARHLIGSADLMPRNLDHRVECVAEVVDPELKARLDEIFSLDLKDDVLAWELRRDGWAKAEPVAGIDAQVGFRRLAEDRARP
ncbi:MAG TPA: polyphosphate kinase 1 [Actinomycetota bacterium]|nr:polyphosphate kinase 1 [Actinomycetota bacterium]